MTQKPTNKYPALSRRGELRPILRDGRIDVQESAIHEMVRAEGRHRLRRRVHIHERVALPFPGPGEVIVAAPQIDDTSPIEIEANRGADLDIDIEAALEQPT